MYTLQVFSVVDKFSEFFAWSIEIVHPQIDPVSPIEAERS